MKIKKTTQLAVASAFLAGTVGCATLSEPVTQREQSAGVGALTGGAGGAVIGSLVGSAVTGGLFGMPLGALAGYYIGDQMKEQDGTERVRLSESDRDIVLTLGDILFEFDRAELKHEAMGDLDPLITYLRENPLQKVVIEGYTDSVGAKEYNIFLSQRRAEFVRNVLIENGITADRVVAQGFGESYPVASNDSAGGRKLNRRVEVKLAKAAG
jgi:outer membrane protein OmpA-like peptidoglycan-associated protein